MGFTGERELTLPVGLRLDGEVYRKVTITEMTGIDEENLASKSIRNNGSKAITTILRRCVQTIEGLAEKKNPEEMLPVEYFHKMLSPDRDFLLLAIRSLSMDEDSFEVQHTCPICGEASPYDVSLTDLPVYEWPDEEPTEFMIELPVGFKLRDGSYQKEVKWRIMNGKQQEMLSTVRPEKQATATLAACMVEAGELGRPTQEQIRRLTSRDRVAAARAAAAQLPGVELTYTAVCDNCGHEWDAEVDVNHFFNMAGEKGSPAGKNGQNAPKRRLRRT